MTHHQKNSTPSIDGRKVGGGHYQTKYTIKKNEEQFSTLYTLLDLDYDMFDVVERLKELTVREYSEILIDKDDLNPPMLFVFGKDIRCRQVYIKLKIKGVSTRHVLCVSFHYAKRKMQFPYA